jgi:hypothetical protein
MLPSLLKSIFHNIAVVLVGFGVALVGRQLDSLFGAGSFQSTVVAVAGWLLVGTGFILRAWAAFHFYQHRMQVISLKPQGSLIVTGPFAILAQSALPRRQRAHLLRRRAGPGVAVRAGDHRRQYPARRSFHQA